MSEEKAKGSLLYKGLIVVLAAMLVGSILYPKKLADEEEANTELCRQRMGEVQKMALQYQKYRGVYNDTLDVLLNFVRTSPQFSGYVDSVVVSGLDSVVTKLNEFRDREQMIMANIPNATDSVMIDSLVRMQNAIRLESRSLAGYVEYIHDRMKNLPHMPMADLAAAFVVIDSKRFTLNMDIVRNLVTSGQLQTAEKAGGDVIALIQEIVEKIKGVARDVPSYTDSGLDSLRYCPSTDKELRLVYVDTSVIKYLNIYCPIDETDIARVEANFLKSKIGGLTLQNHGKIEGGEKSWEKQ